MKGLSSLFRFGGGMVFGIICWSFVTGATFGTGKPAAPPQINLDPSPLDQEIKLATSFAPVVKKVVSSVVSIKVIQREGIAASPLENDPFWRFFMPDEAPQPRRRETQGVGSGVIVSKDGYILTNNHVVDGAEQITVVLQEGNKEYAADILGVDKHSDLAVLKIDAEDLSPITLTDSRLLEVGDVVLAVGSPFGLAQSVTMGIVSATGRAGLGMMDIENFIQTDASINRGNSGGALVDAQGRLVGINTLIMSRSGGNQGVGFAIPVNMARGVMDQIVQFGNVRRGLLGISMQEMSDSMAKQFGLESNRGVLISDVSQGGPADAGG
ncbi:MAG: trypsin-like peptidase domain-containing protein, partial [Flavobacteriales bacterium]|nr:trypsin-like peptidase domain-containing protein [Flavobacteriales bacterium]